MATIYSDVSRTFSEYLLLPNLTTKDCLPEKVDLAAPITKFSKGEEPSIRLNIRLYPRSCSRSQTIRWQLRWPNAAAYPLYTVLNPSRTRSKW